MSRSHSPYVRAALSVLVACLSWVARATGAEPAREAGTMALSVRGLHTFAPVKKDLAAALEFIRETLPKEGVNTLIVEFNYSYNFQSQPEFADPSALGRDEVRQLAAACREKGIALIPQINCLGHLQVMSDE